MVVFVIAILGGASPVVDAFVEPLCSSSFCVSHCQLEDVTVITHCKTTRYQTSFTKTRGLFWGTLRRIWIRIFAIGTLVFHYSSKKVYS